jgi:hypothetical protein
LILQTTSLALKAPNPKYIQSSISSLKRNAGARHNKKLLLLQSKFGADLYMMLIIEMEQLESVVIY